MSINNTSKHLIDAIYSVRGWETYSKTFTKAGRLTKKVEKGMGTLDGRAVKLTKTGKQVGKSWKENVSGTFVKATGASNDLTKALRRASIVAPVWLALRAVMMKVLGTLKDGMKMMREWDKQLTKARATINSLNLTSEQAFDKLKKRIQEISMVSGVGVDKLTSAFFRFSTLGIEFETSLAGAEESLNIALALGGDLDKTARTIAFAYNLLGKSLDQSLAPQQQMADLGAKLFGIWKINAFEMDEFSESLKFFLSTANTANIGLEETIALLTTLSTAGMFGGRGGRMFRTVIPKLTTQVDELSDALGIKLNPRLESTTEILLKVIKKYGYCYCFWQRKIKITKGIYCQIIASKCKFG